MCRLPLARWLSDGSGSGFMYLGVKKVLGRCNRFTLESSVCLKRQTRPAFAPAESMSPVSVLQGICGLFAAVVQQNVQDERSQ